VFLAGLAVMSVDFGNEFMKIAIVKVSIACLFMASATDAAGLSVLDC